jgi:CubicO group peptidase (beta-lactamase class C family)
VVYLKGFGVREAGLGQPVDADTVFQLASCSKPMTSTALAVLAGQGKMSWDDRVAPLLPELQLSDPWITANLTYRDLLSHRSSLPEAAGDILENLGLERDEVLARLRYLPAGYDFRAGYGYSNYGFTAGGEAAARAIGMPYEAMMERILFKPAGMLSTSARFEDYEKAPNRSTSHHLQGGKAYPTLRMPQAQAPAGGVSSTARDMARWLQLHLGRGVLDGSSLASEKELAQTYQVHSLASNNPANFSGSGFYGLGWGVGYDGKGRLHLSHSGAFLMGVRTSATMLPQEEVGIVVLTNAYPTAIPEALSAVFFKMYDGAPADLEFARKVNTAVLGILEGMFDSGYRLQLPAKTPSPAARLTITPAPTPTLTSATLWWPELAAVSLCSSASRRFLFNRLAETLSPSWFRNAPTRI